MGKKITVPVDIYVPDGHEFDGMRRESTIYTNELALVPTFKPIKPAKKVIDLSSLMGSGIDCEFSDGDFVLPLVEKLLRIDSDYKSYRDQDDTGWKYCRIRQSPYVHYAVEMTSCPIPEGLRVRLIWFDLDDGYITNKTTTDYFNWYWNNIIAFEILGVAEGWRYEWEEE